VRVGENELNNSGLHTRSHTTQCPLNARPFAAPPTHSFTPSAAGAAASTMLPVRCLFVRFIQALTLLAHLTPT